MPENIKALKRNKKGYPIPFFTPDPRALPEGMEHKAIALADPKKVLLCWKQNLCWVCGKKLWRKVSLPAGGFTYEQTEKVFVGGPVAAYNRAYTDLACHEECAEYSARVCPMLVNPKHQYTKDEAMPKGVHAAAGMVKGHPVVVVLVVAKSYEVIHVGQDLVFRPCDIVRKRFFHLGEEVTKEQADVVLKGGG